MRVRNVLFQDTSFVEVNSISEQKVTGVEVNLIGFWTSDTSGSSEHGTGHVSLEAHRLLKATLTDGMSIECPLHGVFPMSLEQSNTSAAAVVLNHFGHHGYAAQPTSFQSSNPALGGDGVDHSTLKMSNEGPLPTAECVCHTDGAVLWREHVGSLQSFDRAQSSEEIVYE